MLRRHQRQQWWYSACDCRWNAESVCVCVCVCVCERLYGWTCDLLRNVLRLCDVGGHEEIPSHRLKRCRQSGRCPHFILLYVLSNISPTLNRTHVLSHPWGVWVLFLGPAFFHYCISTLKEAGQVVRRERGLPNERGPKARICNKHSALLHKHTCYKSIKTSAIVTHASAGISSHKTKHTCSVRVRGVQPDIACVSV